VLKNFRAIGCAVHKLFLDNWIKRPPFFSIEVAFSYSTTSCMICVDLRITFETAAKKFWKHYLINNLE